MFKDIGSVSTMVLPGLDISLDLPGVALVYASVREEEGLLIPLRSFVSRLTPDRPWRPPTSSAILDAVI